MNMPLPNEPNQVALIGDVHGNLPWTLRVLTVAKDRGADVAIQLGDFGFIWPGQASMRKSLAHLERRLADLDLVLLWLDGNHEDHTRLQAIAVDAHTGLRTISPRIHHLPRGHRWRWDSTTWLALGGATSLDRHWRVEGESWWAAEALTTEQVEGAIAGGPADVMLCHDAPSGVTVPGLGSSTTWPQEDVERADAHRDQLRRVVNRTRPSQLWHGHLHIRYDDLLRHADGTVTAVHGLSHDNTWIDGNLVIVDTLGRPIRNHDA